MIDYKLITILRPLPLKKNRKEKWNMLWRNVFDVTQALKWNAFDSFIETHRWTDDVIVPTLSVGGGHNVAYTKGSRESISLLYN